MLYIKANHLTDGLYNIKGGEIFKYKAKGGTVRTYEIGDIVRCKECRWYKQSESFCENGNGLWQAGDECFCSYGERSE